MKKVLIPLILLLVFLLAILLFSSNNLERVHYFNDTVSSKLIDFKRNNSLGQKNFSIKTAQDEKFIQVYKDMPAEFSHIGSLLFYRAPKDIELSKLSLSAIRYTNYYKSGKLSEAIRKANGITGSTIAAGSFIYIPSSLPSMLRDFRNKQKPAIQPINGLYFTGTSIANENILASVKKYKSLGINAVVFDAKDITGLVNYYSDVPVVRELNTHEKRSIDNLDIIIRYLKENGIYVIGRIAIFHDHLLFNKKPEWAIHSKSTGGVWSSNAKELWLDPTNRDVQDYNLQIALELIEKGVDEVQFDYIRFPTRGDQGDAKFAYSSGSMSRSDVISQYLKRAHEEINKRNALLSIDIFGIVAWGKEKDIQMLGQRVSQLAPYCDVISPMLYPSHFEDNFDGYAKPGDNPYYFIKTGCDKIKEMYPNAVIRPWLQAFKWRTSNYNESYIITQMKASKDAGAQGYLFWNAANDYGVVYRALEMVNKTHSN